MRRALIYGGCHAAILRDLLMELVTPGSWEFVLLVNFQLIASGRPFPYDDLSKFDVVMFSPIENKPGYETAALRRQCDEIGCRTLCFPWLEWHGYCPGAQKGVFKGRFQWYFPRLAAMADDHASFEAFCREAIERFPDDALIDDVTERSTSKLRASEERNGADIQVSGFIRDNFRASRLFLVSDHPSIVLYRHVLDQIVDLLEIQTCVDVSCLLDEPQWQCRTPLFPRVGRHLGLDFEDPRWVDDELIPSTDCDLRTYLSLYYHRDGVILGPRHVASVFAHDGADAGAVGDRVRLFAQPLRDGSDGVFDRYELHRTLSGASMLENHARFAIRPDEWRSSWGA